MNKVFCCIVTRSHLPFATAVRVSLRQAGNPDDCHFLVIDAPSTEVLPAPGDGCHVHLLAEFAEELPPLIRYYYDAFELCNALKPFFVRRLLRDVAEKVIYLDSDIFAVGSFAPAWRLLDEASVILTPHLLAPPDLDSPAANEIEIVDQGVFNGGFTGWSRGVATTRILTWMCERFVLYGFNDRPRGMFVDQKLLPLLVEYFPDHVSIWRTPAANIAFWNAHERRVEWRNDRYFIGDDAVLFFHLSGYRASQPESPCSYLPEPANRWILRQAPWLLRVLRDYQSLLDSLTATPNPPPYPFVTYNGFTLFPGLRRILFERGSLSWRDSRVFRTVAVERLKRCKRWLLARL